MTEQPLPNTPEEEEVDIEKWNEETKKGLRRLQLAVERLADARHQKLESNAESTFKELRWMIWTTFALGFGLVLTSIVLFVAGNRTLSVLGLGTIGVADWLALFFYKPMDRLQKADQDLLQQIIVVKGWALSVNLEMLAMKAGDPQSMIVASKNIRTATTFAAHSLEKFVSPIQQSQDGERNTKQTQTGLPNREL